MSMAIHHFVEANIQQALTHWIESLAYLKSSVIIVWKLWLIGPDSCDPKIDLLAIQVNSTRQRSHAIAIKTGDNKNSPIFVLQFRHKKNNRILAPTYNQANPTAPFLWWICVNATKRKKNCEHSNLPFSLVYCVNLFRLHTVDEHVRRQNRLQNIILSFVFIQVDSSR